MCAVHVHVRCRPPATQAQVSSARYEPRLIVFYTMLGPLHRNTLRALRRDPVDAHRTTVRPPFFSTPPSSFEHRNSSLCDSSVYLREREGKKKRENLSFSLASSSRIIRHRSAVNCSFNSIPFFTEGRGGDYVNALCCLSPLIIFRCLITRETRLGSIGNYPVPDMRNRSLGVYFFFFLT